MDYYEILKIQPDASGEKIKNAYRSLAKDYHPDNLAGVPDAVRKLAEEKFKKINEAYETLSNPEKRKVYDAERLSSQKQDLIVRIGELADLEQFAEAVEVAKRLYESFPKDNKCCDIYAEILSAYASQLAETETPDNLKKARQSLEQALKVVKSETIRKQITSDLELLKSVSRGATEAEPKKGNRMQNIQITTERAVKMLRSGVPGIKAWNQFRKVEDYLPGLEGVDLSGANLSGANLSKANLQTANLEKANLNAVNFENSNLAECNLNEAEIISAKFTKANLSHANLLKTKIWGCNFCESILVGTNFQESVAYLEEIIALNGYKSKDEAKRAVIKTYPSKILILVFKDGYYYDRAKFVKISTNFSNAKLTSASFLSAKLLGCKFQQADLSGVNFSQADLSYANLESANLSDAIFTRTNLTDASLKNTKMFEAADVEGAIGMELEWEFE